MSLIAENVSYAWEQRDGRHAAVDSFTGEFAPGVPHLICGPSGSGKSTLSLLLAGLIRSRSGKVRFDGVPVAEQRSAVACVFQFPESIYFEDSVREELAQWSNGGTVLNTEYFDRLQIPFSQFADLHPYHLSAGYGRLVAIALQLAREPRLLILDEPTIGLDWDHHHRMTAVLKGWIRPERTLIVVTHDLDLMSALGGQAWVMAERKLAWSGGTAELLTAESRLREYGLIA